MKNALPLSVYRHSAAEPTWAATRTRPALAEARAPGPDTMTDEELIAQYYACSQEALEELRKRYEKQLYRFFERATGNRDIAQDLTQEVLIKILMMKGTPP